MRSRTLIFLVGLFASACTSQQITSTQEIQDAVTNDVRELAYGVDVRQKMDLLLPEGEGPHPIILFVHGGGWADGDKREYSELKQSHFPALGWGYASTNYRLVPAHGLSEQAADVAMAIAYLRKHPKADGEKIVIIGHSSGAHIAALVASDPKYLAAVGEPITAIRGVILLDGAGYDVVKAMPSPRPRVQEMYLAAFSSDRARQRYFSPIEYTASPNSTDWLILPLAERDYSVDQSNEFAKALLRSGSNTLVVPIENETHLSLYTGIGEEGDAATAEIDKFLSDLN